MSDSEVRSLPGLSNEGPRVASMIVGSDYIVVSAQWLGESQNAPLTAWTGVSLQSIFCDEDGLTSLLRHGFAGGEWSGKVRVLWPNFGREYAHVTVRTERSAQGSLCYAIVLSDQPTTVAASSSGAISVDQPGIPLAISHPIPGPLVAVSVVGLDDSICLMGKAGKERVDIWVDALLAKLRGRYPKGKAITRTAFDEISMAWGEIENELELRQVLSDVNCALESQLHAESGSLELSFSIGTSRLVSAPANVQELTKQAQSALFHGRASGGKRIVYFDDTAIAPLGIFGVEELAKSLERQEFSLAFQPRVSGAEQKVVCLEALARWTSGGKVVSPGEFILAAEESGSIVALGEWITTAALDSLVRVLNWHTMPVVMAINVSPTQLRCAQFADWVGEQIVARELDPKLVELEVTESALVNLPAHAVQGMARLRRLGVSIAIDDFGTGYSSYRRLQQMPVDTLKIDRGFVSSLSEHQESRAIVRSIITLAKELGIRVVAEGVEMHDQLERLLDWGCDEIQGFLLSPPVPEAMLPVAMAGINQGASFWKGRALAGGLMAQQPRNNRATVSKHAGG